METQKDRSLRRRIQSLQCFLFEQLHRELNQGAHPQATPAPAPAKAANPPLPTTSEPAAASLAKAASPPTSPSQPPAEPAGTASAAPSQQSIASPPSVEDITTLTGTAAKATPAAAAAAAAATASTAAAGGFDAADGEGGQQEPEGVAAMGVAAGEGGTSWKTVIDGTFGIVVRQRTKVLTGLQLDKFRESRSFQVLPLLQPAFISSHITSFYLTSFHFISFISSTA